MTPVLYIYIRAEATAIRGYGLSISQHLSTEQLIKAAILVNNALTVCHLASSRAALYNTFHFPPLFTLLEQTYISSSLFLCQGHEQEFDLHLNCYSINCNSSHNVYLLLSNSSTHRSFFQYEVLV